LTNKFTAPKTFAHDLYSCVIGPRLPFSR